jgi:hypothetical protein
MNRASRVILLAEDQRHQSFVCRYLRHVGYSNHDVRRVPLPAGRGCGEQWVRERYAAEVAAYRQRSARAATALIVAIDADNGDRVRRLIQFQSALQNAQMFARENDERIAHVIPRRNVETWILCLNGVEVDEETDYSRQGKLDELIQQAATIFYEWSRPNAIIPNSCIASLRETISETRRIEAH